MIIRNITLVSYATYFKLRLQSRCASALPEQVPTLLSACSLFYVLPCFAGVYVCAYVWVYVCVYAFGRH